MQHQGELLNIWFFYNYIYGTYRYNKYINICLSVYPSESRAISRHVLRKYSVRPEEDDTLDKCISRLVSCILGQTEDKTSEVNLLREGNLEETALVDVWLDVEANQYEPTIAPIVYQLLLVPMNGGTPDQKLIDDSLEKMKKVLDVYEARLSKCKYLAGDFVSLADLSHFPYTVHFVATPFASVFDSYPRVKAWVQGLLSRPAAQRVISQFPKY